MKRNLFLTRLATVGKSFDFSVVYAVKIYENVRDKQVPALAKSLEMEVSLQI